MSIGVLGGTGPLGSGLAARLADLGHDVVLGSREAARGVAARDELLERWGDRVATLRGGSNEDAAAADTVVLATVWEGLVATAAAHARVLAGKDVVCVGNGLERVGREFHAVLPPEGSLSLAVQDAAPDARIVAAFQHVPARALAALDSPVHSDVVVCGNDEGARTRVLALVTSIPDLRAFDGGSLANAIGIEAFAALLLTVNIRHKGEGSLQFLGLDGYRPSPEA